MIKIMESILFFSKIKKSKMNHINMNYKRLQLKQQ